MATLKTCARCGETKELRQFNKRSESMDGHQGYCRDCSNEYRRGRKYKTCPIKKRAQDLKSNYGITPEYVRELLWTQGYRCAICGTKNHGGKHNSWNVDPCHKTGKVRGMLCGPCNRGLGCFKDSRHSLIVAANYVAQT